MLRYLRSCSMAEWEVWDRPTRFFHWATTALLAATLLTGWFDPAWQLDRHLLFGGTVGGLLLFRFIWGLVGPEYSRFTHYFYSLDTVLTDIRDLAHGRAKSGALGLNPLSAWVSIALLLTLCALLLTGLMAYGGEEHQGPLASLIAFETGRRAHAVHAYLSLLSVLLLALHIWIIRRESQLTEVSLLRSMITGCKPMEVDQPADHIRDPNLNWAMIIGVLLLFAIDHISKTLGQLPMDGWRPLSYPTAYQEKCGHCHWTIHPSLLPEEAWQELLAHLDNHFGQKVSLTGKEAVAVTSFLLVHAAEDWNTDAAHRFRKPTPDPAHWITRHPMWQKVHINVDAALFDKPPVKSRINCPVCHHDALSGRFDRHAIHMPGSTEKSTIAPRPD
ncbi:MAG: cytochrome b/b6 domain-containing protein [Magnetococcus sp. YQC-3]